MMFKLYFMYPFTQTRFDKAYFEGHMLRAQALFGSACTGISIEHGNAKIFPCDYAAIGVFEFDSKDAAFDAAVPVLKQICDDIPNFTDADPVISAAIVQTPAARA
ncbi:MAG: EthD family reductase [Ruminococcaceae bacterium]|nr:EthD family reductase [Oscillospiraceae bacterium]